MFCPKKLVYIVGQMSKRRVVITRGQSHSLNLTNGCHILKMYSIPSKVNWPIHIHVKPPGVEETIFFQIIQVT